MAQKKTNLNSKDLERILVSETLGIAFENWMELSLEYKLGLLKHEKNSNQSVLIHAIEKVEKIRELEDVVFATTIPLHKKN